jgi:hypothetical protein
MSKIGCREIYFIETKQSSQIDFLVDKVKETIKDMSLPPEYDVRIYKNVYACCGVGSNSIIVEVAGPEEETIKAIDLKAMSKILEFCEKEGYTTGHHTLQQYEFL